MLVFWKAPRSDAELWLLVCMFSLCLCGLPLSSQFSSHFLKRKLAVNIVNLYIIYFTLLAQLGTVYKEHGIWLKIYTNWQFFYMKVMIYSFFYFLLLECTSTFITTQHVFLTTNQNGEKKPPKKKKKTWQNSSLEMIIIMFVAIVDCCSITFYLYSTSKKIKQLYRNPDIELHSLVASWRKQCQSRPPVTTWGRNFPRIHPLLGDTSDISDPLINTSQKR